MAEDGLDRTPPWLIIGIPAAVLRARVMDIAKWHDRAESLSDSPMGILSPSGMGFDRVFMRSAKLECMCDELAGNATDDRPGPCLGARSREPA